MNILLVNPPRFEGIPVIREERCEITERYSVVPPYSLLQIASLLRERGHNVSLIDANVSDMRADQLRTDISSREYDALIFRFTPTTFDNDMEVAQISKSLNPGATTIGICWTMRTLPEEVLNSAPDLDIYIMHEYEVVAPKLIETIANGDDISSVPGIAYREDDAVVVNPDAKPIGDYDSIPLPAYDLLSSLKDYYINTRHGSPFTIMYTSKGCPYNCIYCTVAGTKWKPRSAESVLNEIRYLKENHSIKTISFFDETFTIDRGRVVEICDGLINGDLNVTWYCNTRANLVDWDLLKLMRKAGCKGMSFGIESGNQTILDNVNKGTTVEQAERAIKMAKDAGIKVYTSFMFGLPGETWKTVNETISFIKRTLPTGAQFNVTVPYPGTKLYDMAVEKGWISNDLDWKQLYQHASVMENYNMSSKDVEEARLMAYRALYLNPRWILQNIAWVIKYPSDFPMAVRYYAKALNNLLINKMKHAH
jgi:radical SAM superfamily enzyme YgiQ (UPF0313 family)